MKSRIVFFTFSIVIFSSCGAGLLPDMSRSLDEPVVRKPEVSSFITENTISVRWKEDEGTDEFILYRKPDNLTADYEIVYRGSAREYTDTGVEGGAQYLYTLGNVRGTRHFGPSDAVLGVGSDVRRDEYEPNDGREEATELSTDITANIFFYAAYSGETVEDADWYVMTVPPKMQANIIFIQQDFLGSGPTHMDLYLENESRDHIDNGDTIVLANNTLAAKDLRFRISPNDQQFFTDYSLVGGALKVYVLKIHSFTSLSRGGV